MPNEPQEWTPDRVYAELPTVKVRLLDRSVVEGSLARDGEDFLSVWIPFALVSARMVRVATVSPVTVAYVLNNDVALSV